MRCCDLSALQLEAKFEPKALSADEVSLVAAKVFDGLSGVAQGFG